MFGWIIIFYCDEESDGQQFHEYQQCEQIPHPEHKKNTTTYDVWSPGLNSTNIKKTNNHLLP